MPKLVKVAQSNPYKTWIRGEGIPIIEGYSIDDVMTVPLKPWPRIGGRGAYIDLVGSDNLTGAYVCEIPPGKSLNPEKHLFEELIYVVSGKGSAAAWNEDGDRQTFQWQEGSLFSPPLNSWHELTNKQSDKAARFLAVTGAPVFMNLFHNSDFIFNNDFAFKDRYSGQSDYFTSEGRIIQLVDDRGKIIQSAIPAIWERNLFQNVLDALRPSEIIGLEQMWKGGKIIHMVLSDNTMELHIGEFEPGTYMKAHRHDGGAHIIMLSGKGYSLMWPDRAPEQRIRCDWHKGSVISPPENWWHMHFATGTETYIHMALRWCGNKYRFNNDWQYLDRRNIIEYYDEDPEIRRIFEAELAKDGLKSKMDKSLYKKK
ncbi:MAG: cupin domain-containing protein [Chloroflexi bacterium]|nr:cupin domain-containing protein [Chloroflexota bacterium]